MPKIARQHATYVETLGRAGHRAASGRSTRGVAMSAMPGSILDRAVRREPLDGHDGRSGAVLERAVLDDGTKLVVKTAAPGADLPGAATGDPGRELWLWSSGILGQLPAGVGHAIIDGWPTGDGTIVTVMRHLGDAVVGWRGPITRSRCRRLLRAATASEPTSRGGSPRSASRLTPRPRGHRHGPRPGTPRGSR